MLFTFGLLKVKQKTPMNKLITSSVLFLLLISTGINAQEIKKTHKDSLNSVVTEYYNLNLKIFQQNSNVQDIDNVFKLFTDDFVYIHPKYGGTYSRKDLYNGYIRNQKNGGYDGSIIDIKILNKIIGLNAVVVKRKFVEKTGGKIKDGEPEMTFFEFKNGKISRIFEYW